MNPYARSGTYSISLTGDGKSPLIPVYCDMSEKIGWTKILQIAQPYQPQNTAFGNVSIGSTFTGSGKLVDSVINGIDDNLRQASSGNVFYRLTATDTSDRVYVSNPKMFDDTAIAWNLFNGERRQCFGSHLEKCSWFTTSYRTLDTLYDGSASGEERRFFTEHDGAGSSVKCQNPPSALRCVSRGSVCAYCMHKKVELWVGY